MRFLKLIVRLTWFLLLTVLTQIGGIIYLISVFITQKWQRNFPLKGAIVFIVLYLFTTFLVIPVVAPFFGREPVRNSDIVKPASYLTILLNRNYVKPEVNELLKEAEQNLQGTPVKILYLDANFPFIDGFPLLPHLTHNDGRKLDIAFVYETKDGKIVDKVKSISGYGVFEEPKPGEPDQISKCKETGYFQYDFTKFLTLGRINQDLVFSEKGTKLLIESLLKSEKIEKIFIEPHIKHRLGLEDSRIRYHGCHSVRHDDHIHIQVK